MTEVFGTCDPAFKRVEGQLHRNVLRRASHIAM